MVFFFLIKLRIQKKLMLETLFECDSENALKIEGQR